VLNVHAKIGESLTGDFCCDDYWEAVYTAVGGGGDIGCVRPVACRRSPVMLSLQGQAEK
jgi:hypothetical protein